MQRPYQHLEVSELDGVSCVRIKDTRIHADGLEQLGTELARLVDEDGCRKMVLSLGPGDLICLYSVFLAKLINLQRRLDAAGGTMALAEASANTEQVFRATGLDRHFKFFPDPKAAVDALA